MIQTAIQFRFFLVHRVHLGDGADIVEKIGSIFYHEPCGGISKTTCPPVAARRY